MSIDTQLYQGKLVCLGPIEYEKDSEIESSWTHNSTYLHSLGQQMARPLSPAKVKKRYEAIEKEVDKSRNLFYFTIRNRGDGLLLGYARLFWVEWTSATSGLQIVIGNPDERDQPYAHEALQLVLRFAFRELNFYRLSAYAFTDDPQGIALLQSAGFYQEVCCRQSIQRKGQTSDLLLMGLLREEWNDESRKPRVENMEKASNISKHSPLTTHDLFAGNQVQLTAEDPKVMAKAFANWNLDTEYFRYLDSDPPRLRSEKQLKDWFEKDLDKDDPKSVFFMIRTKDGEKPIGFVALFDLYWNHGDAMIGIGLGEREYWGKGYGTDAMRVLLRYAFMEMNLRRLTLLVFGYNPRAIRSYQKCGFTHEGTVPGVLHREGQRWDWHYMGILKEEWEQQNDK